MKNVHNLPCIAIAMLLAISTYAQDIEIGGNYYFKTTLNNALTKTKLQLNGNDTISNDVQIRNKAKIKVVDVVGDVVYFKYLNYRSQAPEYRVYNVDANNDTKIFSMSTKDFETLTNVYYNKFRGFKYGAYTVPTRLRIHKGNFEFDANLSLNTNIIARAGLSRYNANRYIDFSIGVGVTKVNLNEENSLLGTPGTRFDSISVLSPTAFTVSIGTLFNLSDDVNLGIYAGWDFISSADNRAEWIYNKKTWIGIGLNVSFSNGGERSNAEPKDLESDTGISPSGIDNTGMGLDPEEGEATDGEEEAGSEEVPDTGEAPDAGGDASDGEDTGSEED